MPQYVVDRVAEALNDDGKAVKGSRVCVLGVAYKKDVDDPRESPAFTDPGAAASDAARSSPTTIRMCRRLPRMRHHRFAHGQPAADAGVLGRAGLRADRHRPLGATTAT